MPLRKKCSTKWKTKETTWIFVFQKYGTFWSVLLGYFIKHKPLIPEECISFSRIFNFTKKISSKLLSSAKFLQYSIFFCYYAFYIGVCSRSGWQDLDWVTTEISGIDCTNNFNTFSLHHIIRNFTKKQFIVITMLLLLPRFLPYKLLGCGSLDAENSAAT